jgi:hypothetical protein
LKRGVIREETVFGEKSGPRRETTDRWGLLSVREGEEGCTVSRLS